MKDKYKIDPDITKAETLPSNFFVSGNCDLATCLASAYEVSGSEK